jgi:hypothetical protein
MLCCAALRGFTVLYARGYLTWQHGLWPIKRVLQGLESVKPVVRTPSKNNLV